MTLRFEFASFAAILILLVAIAAAPNRDLPRNSKPIRLDADEHGDRIPDFSNCGYEGGGVALPVVLVRVTVNPVSGDAGPVIQEAIDNVSAMAAGKSGFRGAVLLKRGRYAIGRSLRINASGVVLRGESDGEDGTVLIATGTSRRSLVVVGTGGRWREVGSRCAVADAYVPVGARSFHLESVDGLKIGSRVMVCRPSTQEWIHVLGMDRIPPRKDHGTVTQWQPGSKDLYFDRVITGIDGRQIMIDAPITCALDHKYGGGTVVRYEYKERINHVGIESLRGVSEYRGATDEEHSWTFLDLRGIENGWVKKITAEHFALSAVQVGRGGKWITVEDCNCLDPVSKITGGRRYSFNLNGGELTLWQRCHARNGRHDFVTGATVAGPNVFLDCTAEKTHADSGPHHRWAVGTLYENVETDGELNVRDRGNSGSGHGWAGANQVFWNCKAKEIICQRPPTANNWAIGCIAKQRSGNGRWESFDHPVEPISLYRSQLAQRLKNAVK